MSHFVSGPGAIDLSVVLPVHNEELGIAAVVDEWLARLSSRDITFEIILCEDGSTDRTKEVLQQLAASRSYLRLDSVARRRGYGPALTSGILKARGRYVLTSDSDGQVDPERLWRLWDRREAYDALMGVRAPRHDPAARLFISRAFGLYHRLLFGTRLRDPSSSFVLIETAKARRILPLLGFLREGYWWGFAGAAIKLDLRIGEVEIGHRKRLAGSSRVYTPLRLPGIAMRNAIGLSRLRFARVQPETRISILSRPGKARA